MGRFFSLAFSVRLIPEEAASAAVSKDARPTIQKEKALAGVPARAQVSGGKRYQTL